MKDCSSYFSYFFSLNNESVVFPVNTACLLMGRCVHPSDPHLQSHSSYLPKISLFCFPPSDQLTLRSPRLPVSWLGAYLPFIQTCTAVAELHIERRRGLTSWSCESRLNRCSSWADTQVSPCESMLLMQRESGSQQWCDKLRFLIFHSADLFLPSTALPPINNQLSPPTLLSHSPILFPISFYPLERKAYSNGNEEG